MTAANAASPSLVDKLRAMLRLSNRLPLRLMAWENGHPSAVEFRAEITVAA